MQIVWVWIPLNTVSKKNGLCGFTPGSHRRLVGPVEHHEVNPGEVLILDERSAAEMARSWGRRGSDALL